MSIPKYNPNQTTASLGSSSEYSEARAELKASPPPEIPELLSHLQGILSDQRQIIVTLSNRLSPVCASTPDNPCRDTSHESRTPLGSTLYSFLESIHDHNTLLRTLNSSLEL